MVDWQPKDDDRSAEEQVDAQQQQQAQPEEQVEQEDEEAPQQPLNNLNSTVQVLTQVEQTMVQAMNAIKPHP